MIPKLTIQQMEEQTAGVICLHCRMQTPVANRGDKGLSEKTSTKSRPRISIVRCVQCGGEAPYLAHEIVAMKIISRAGMFAA